MGSRAWLNLVLLVAVLGLAIGVYFSSQAPAEPELQRLTGLMPEAVEKLALTRGEEVLRFEQAMDGAWQMQSPVAVAANPVLLTRMLAAFGLQSQQHYALLESELKKYGLDKPVVELVAAGHDLAFGRLNPLNSLRYVRVGDQVHMVAENDIAFLQQDWTAYVAPALLPANAQVERLTIEGLGSLQASTAGWQYTGDYAPQSADQMQALVDLWRAAQGLEIRALSESALAALGGIHVDVELAAAEPLHFVLVKQAEQWLVVRPALGLAYQVTDAERMLEWPSLDGELE